MITKHRAMIWTGLWWALAQVACAQDLPLTSPPAGTLFYYPMSVAAHQDNTGQFQGDKVYIVNSNFDQRFDAGWVTELDMPTLTQVLGTSGGEDYEAVRTAFRSSLKVPNLGAGMSVSGQRAYIPHRGTGLLTVLDIDPSGSVHCGDSSNKKGLVPTLARTQCDSAHLIDLVALATANPPANNTFNRHDYQDPFSSAILPAENGSTLVSVGYISSAWLTVLQMPAGTSPAPTFRRHIAVGTGAVSSLQPTPNESGKLTATSRKIDTTADMSSVYTIDVATSVGSGTDSLVKNYVFNDAGGQDVYSAAFSPDGNRLYVTNRSPDSVVALQSWSPPVGGLGGAVNYTNNPNMRVTSAAVIDSTLPSDLVYLSRGGANDLVAVAGLLTDSIYFFSPRNGVLQLVSRIKLSKGPTRQDGNKVTTFSGRGPYGMVHAQRAGAYDYLVVSTFYDHGVSIIDVSGAEVLNYREVTHISEGGSLGNAQRSR